MIEPRTIDEWLHALINGPALSRVQGVSDRGLGRGDIGKGMGRRR